MNYYYIASALSVLTACFTAAASWVPDKKKSFFFMVAQCLIYAVASYFYGVYSTIPTMLLCALRNYLVAKNMFPLRVCIPFTVITAIFGIYFNNAGWLGWIPIIATAEFSLLSCIFNGLLASKWNILVNLLMWVIYDVLIWDFASLAMDLTSCGVTLAAILHIRKMKTL